jgi:hypothetical protein
MAAIFALAGTLLGVLGTLAVELTRARAGDVRARREALRLACADFTTAVARMRNLAIDLMRKPGDVELINAMSEAHRDARAHYERLRLTATSKDVQRAGRHVLRYAYGLLRQAVGEPLRDDERERGPLMMFHDWLMILYAEVRRELRLPQADDVYREPDEWVGPASPRPSTGTVPSVS